jgi:23S rRNA pseudouridine1911/1915/1917 synthase
MTPAILFEDNFFLAIDKPPLVSVNRSENETLETIQDWASTYLKIPLTEKKPEEKDSFYTRTGIVHRIDKETSGVLLIAKTEAAFATLQSQFLSRSVKKKYLTLVHGLTPEHDMISAPVGRLPWNRRKFGVIAEGREAVTSYVTTCSGTYLGQSYSYLEVTPTTGRTHQIRIHLKHINHSIVSDPLYSGKNVYREDVKWCPRLFLHACFLSIVHPDTANPMEIISNLPADLEQALSHIIS